MDKIKRGAGGTSGGLMEFFIGLVMIMVGGYLFMSRVVVTSRGFGFSFGNFGVNSFGLAVVPMLIGIGILFFNGKNFWGWVLTIGGLLIVLFGVLINLNVYFQPTNLFDTLLILGAFAGGIGLVARALQPHDKTDS